MAYNPLYFKVKDSASREYNSDLFATNTVTGGLKNGTVSTNDTVRGTVVFQVPKSASGFAVIYQPLVFPQPAPVRIDLGT